MWCVCTAEHNSVTYETRMDPEDRLLSKRSQTGVTVRSRTLVVEHLPSLCKALGLVPSKHEKQTFSTTGGSLVMVKLC